jgi:predicted RNA-binding protein with PUA-like domain
MRLVEPGSGRDLTRRMERFAAERLRSLERAGLDGYVLKARSPSCGMAGVQLFPPGGARPRRAGRGLFAAALLERLPALPVAEEEGLRDPRARREFLARVLEHRRRRTAPEANMNRWLVKSDPGDYSFADLRRDGVTAWTGVKNPLAQRHLRGMRKGDAVLVYETGGVKAVVGLATVARDPYPDPGRPALVAVDLRAGKPLARPVPLAAAKADPALRDFPLVRMGRLSVMPVAEAQWKRLLAAK